MIRFRLSNCWNVNEWNLFHYFAIISRGANPYASVSNLECKKRVGRQHTTFTLCQNAACSNEYFLLRIDYAMEGSTFWLNKLCCRLFHAERSWHAHWFSVFIVSGRHDWWFALGCRSIFFDLFWNVNFFIADKEGFRYCFNFSLKSLLDLNNWKRFSFVSECDGFLQWVLSRWVQLVSVLQDVKFSRLVIHRSKFPRMDCSLNWSYRYFKYGELRCESVKIAL